MHAGFIRKAAFLCFSFFCIALPQLHAQRPVYQIIYDTDDYTFRGSGYYWNATPSGSITKYRSGQGLLPIDAGEGFSSYPTLYAEGDWKFRPRQHLTFIISPNSTSRNVTLQQTIIFQGITFNANAAVTAKLSSYSFAPAYQYDFFRSERGHLGALVEVNFLDVSAEIDGQATVTNSQGGSATRTTSDSRSEFAPLPGIGLEGKYFLTERLYGEGFGKLGYYFSYGSAYSLKGVVGAKLSSHIDLKGGYLVGERLAISGVTDNTHVNLRQSGPIVGMQYSF